MNMTEEEKSCSTCAVSQAGMKRIKEANDIMAGVSMECVRCCYNPGRQLFGGILDLLGEPTDNWQPIEKE